MSAGNGYIHDFRVEVGSEADLDAILARIGEIERAIANVLCGAPKMTNSTSSSSTPGSIRRAVVWLRAWFRYLRQTGSSFGLVTVVDALRRAPAATTRTDRAVRRRPRPVPSRSATSRSRRTQSSSTASLAAVRSIDDDRILRRLRALVEAIVRTNAFAPAAARSAGVQDRQRAGPRACRRRCRGAKSGSIQPARRRHSLARRPGRPRRPSLVRPPRRFPHRNPRPDEGADGEECGDRPDRRQGRLLSQATADRRADRDAWLAEGTESYRIFIRSLLSITDNLVNDKVVHPDNVVIHDGDDPYFVVAADKGTATFSDIANGIALDAISGLATPSPAAGRTATTTRRWGSPPGARGFPSSAISSKWASTSSPTRSRSPAAATCRATCSATACCCRSRSSWSRRSTIATSSSIPIPIPRNSWAERKRMFDLPRSSWDDYDRKLSVEGRRHLSRAREKSIPLERRSARRARHRRDDGSTRRA